MRTAGNLTPLQQWVGGIFDLNGPSHSSEENDTSSDEDSAGVSLLDRQQAQELSTVLNPLANSPLWGIDMYASVLDIIAQNKTVVSVFHLIQISVVHG